MQKLHRPRPSLLPTRIQLPTHVRRTSPRRRPRDERAAKPSTPGAFPLYRSSKPMDIAPCRIPSRVRDCRPPSLQIRTKMPSTLRRWKRPSPLSVSATRPDRHLPVRLVRPNRRSSVLSADQKHPLGNPLDRARTSNAASRLPALNFPDVSQAPARALLPFPPWLRLGTRQGWVFARQAVGHGQGQESLAVARYEPCHTVRALHECNWLRHGAVASARRWTRTSQASRWQDRSLVERCQVGLLRLPLAKVGRSRRPPLPLEPTMPPLALALQLRCHIPCTRVRWPPAKLVPSAAVEMVLASRRCLHHRPRSP